MTLRVMWRYIWKSWNSYSLQVKYCKMYISQSETSKIKISKFSHPARVKNLLRFALSLTVSEITANLHYWGSCDIKSKIACNNPARVENALHFTLSLTFSEMTANLHFQGHVTLRVMWRKNQKFSRRVSKKYLNKIYLKKLKFLLVTGEILENVY